MKKSLICVFFAAILYIYMFFIVYPYVSANDFLSEGSNPDIIKTLVCSLLLLPPLIAFAIFFCNNVFDFKCIRFIIYPLSAIIFIFGSLLISIGLFGGAIIWFFILGFLPICIFVSICFIIGLINDIKDFKNSR